MSTLAISKSGERYARDACAKAKQKAATRSKRDG
jgi:hypothetical protein